MKISLFLSILLTVATVVSCSKEEQASNEESSNENNSNNDRKRGLVSNYQLAFFQSLQSIEKDENFLVGDVRGMLASDTGQFEVVSYVDAKFKGHSLSLRFNAQDSLIEVDINEHYDSKLKVIRSSLCQFKFGSSFVDIVNSIDSSDALNKLQPLVRLQAPLSDSEFEIVYTSNFGKLNFGFNKNKELVYVSRAFQASSLDDQDLLNKALIALPTLATDLKGMENSNNIDTVSWYMINEDKSNLEKKGYGVSYPVFEILKRGGDSSKYLTTNKVKIDHKKIEFYYATISKKMKSDLYIPPVFDLKEELLTVLLKSQILDNILNIELVSDSKIILKIKPVASADLMKLMYPNGNLNCIISVNRELKVKRIQE